MKSHLPRFGDRDAVTVIAHTSVAAMGVPNDGPVVVRIATHRRCNLYMCA